VHHLGCSTGQSDLWRELVVVRGELQGSFMDKWSLGASGDKTAISTINTSEVYKWIALALP
jgi:hypothetical protein